MSLIASSRSGARAPRNRHAAGEASTSPPTDDVAVPLPRHLLVSLAGIAADVTSLRARSVDDPQLHDPLDKILGKLDGLVDDIYERAANSGSHPVEAPDGHGSVITADHPATALAVPALNGQRRSR